MQVTFFYKFRIRVLNPMIKGVIFDLDGTILNSVDLRVKAWKKAFQTFDISVSDNEIRPLIGLPGENLAGRYHKHPEEIEKAEEEYFSSHLKEASLFPDVEGTVAALSKKGIDSVIVTSSRKILVNRLTLPVSRTVTIDDVTKGKPDTEAYLKALAFMGIEASNLLVVGDAESDLIPAKRIGATSAMVLHGQTKSSKYADHYMQEIGEVEHLVEKLNTVKSQA